MFNKQSTNKRIKSPNKRIKSPNKKIKSPNKKIKSPNKKLNYKKNKSSKMEITTNNQEIAENLIQKCKIKFDKIDRSIAFEILFGEKLSISNYRKTKNECVNAYNFLNEILFKYKKKSREDILLLPKDKQEDAYFHYKMKIENGVWETHSTLEYIIKFLLNITETVPSSFD